MSAVVAIIGRPNVGKSTLFNRLVRRRAALVDPLSGLTRDLRRSPCDIGGRALTLIDSAGLDEDDNELISRMTQQTLRTVEAADVVLFVMDARAGLTTIDESWAQAIRKKAKKIILVANKCESAKNSASGMLDAHRLGFGAPIAISAEHNLGMGDLESAISENLPKIPEVPEAPEMAEQRILKMAIIGRPNVGKSSLINRLLGEERQMTGAEPGITRDAIPLDWEWEGHAIQLFDTAGLRRKSRIFARAEALSVSSALQAIRFADVVVLLMEVGRLFENQDLKIADLIAREGRAPVLAVNKIDLSPDLTEQTIAKAAQRLLPQIGGVPIVCLSATTGQGVDCLMPKIMHSLEMWNRQINTAVLNNWLKNCVARHPPPSSSRRAVRIKYVTQKSARPPSFVIFTSHTKRLPDDYKRYLINDMRSTFGFEGTPIRIDVRASVNPYI